jgi:hypothetical protein
MRSVLSRWRSLGVHFDVASARGTPDLERLLLDTASLLPRNARLFHTTVAWLRRHGDAIARHRLRRLIATEPDHDALPALALLLDSSRTRSSMSSERPPRSSNVHGGGRPPCPSDGISGQNRRNRGRTCSHHP